MLATMPEAAVTTMAGPALEPGTPGFSRVALLQGEADAVLGSLVRKGGRRLAQGVDRVWLCPRLSVGLRNRRSQVRILSGALQDSENRAHVQGLRR